MYAEYGEPRPSTSADGWFPPPAPEPEMPPGPPLETAPHHDVAAEDNTISAAAANCTATITADTATPAPEDTVPADPPTETQYYNEELMRLLGEDPSQKKVYGKEIHPDLATRLQHMATVGLSKEARKELMDKYLPPVNSVLIDAPNLNAEVKAAVSEAVYKRDKGIELQQKQTASAISCIAEALTILFSSEQTNTEVVKFLIDAQKLLCDSQHANSVVRRNFVLHNIKKELKDQLQSTKIDNFLFSESLAETIRTAKAISKTGADMKPTPVKPAPKKQHKPQKNLNWRGPPHSYRPKGAPRMKEPVPTHKPRPESSSRPSSRPAPSRSRR